MKEVQFPEKKVHVGQNFVFFSSLLKDDPSLAKQTQKILSSNIKDLTFQEDSNNKMSAMIHFFDAVIKREQRIEKLFLQRQREKFKDMPNFQSILNYLNTNSFNYIDFIKMLNIAIKGVDECKKTLENELTRVQQLQEIIDEKMRTKTYSEKRRFSEQTIKTSTLHTSGILSEEETNRINKTLADITGEKIEQAMSQIIKEPELSFKIKTFIEQNYPLNENGKKIKVTSAMIVNYLIQALYKKLDIVNIQNNIEQIFNTSLEPIFSELPVMHRNSKIKSDEEDLLYVEGKGLADEYLKKLERKKPQKTKTIIDFMMLKKNANELQDENIDKLTDFIKKIETKTIQEGDQITIGKTTYRYENGSYIRIGSKKKDKPLTKKQIISNLKMRLSVILKNFIQQTFNQEELAQIINTDFYIYTPRLAESIAGIESSLIENIHGKVRISGHLNLKNDAEFFISYNPNSFIKHFQKNKTYLLDNFSDLVAKAEHLYREKRQTNKGIAYATTDPKLSAKAFFSAVDKIINTASARLEKLTQDSQEIESELSTLLNGLYVQESVKDIQFLNPELGFKGGSLGGDWEAALQNLLSMYELGGLSPINYQWLHFTILNSSSASLGGYLKNPVQKYLSFAAAMMMFNYGGAELERIAKELQYDFSKSYGPDFLNIYVLDGIYFPSSYILTLIRDGLIECQTILESNIKPTNLSETGVKIINKSSPSWINPKANPYSKEWERIGEKTSKQIEIIFTFLGGFLDIIDELNNRMAI